MNSSEIALMIALPVLVAAISFRTFLNKAVVRLKRNIRIAFLRILEKILLATARRTKLIQLSVRGKEVHAGQLTPLIPIDTADNFVVYDSELVGMIDHPRVYNIAITGPYGSGKSSLLSTFFQNHPEYCPLYISLAAFRDETDPLPATEQVSPAVVKTAAELKQLDEQQMLLNERIEFSILQQLFYHVKGGQIPFSRFKRIRTVSHVKTGLLSIALLVYIIALLFIYKKTWLPFPENVLADLSNQSKTWIIYSAIAYVTFASLYLIYMLIGMYKSANLIKLNLNSAELEIAPDKDASALNQHVDEIVYFFATTQYNLLVIEDLDRFKNPEIFVKLREINTLINNSLQVKRKVAFIYALRDDVFKDESRTKFFDIIFPILPNTNAANSASTFIQAIKELNLERPIKQELLEDIALYITDARLVANILNEFKIYRKLLANIEVNYTLLFSLIVYKNLYPTDFTALQANKGMVYSVFQSRNTFIEPIIAHSVERVKVIDDILRSVESCVQKSVKELRLTYLAVLFDQIQKAVPNFTGMVSISYGMKSLDELTRDEYFNELMGETRLTVNTQHSISYYRDFSFKNIERLLDDHHGYHEREAELKSVLSEDVEVLKQELSDHNSIIRKAKGYTLQQIFAHHKFNGSAIVNYPVLVFLLGNGYLNEDYPYYLSQFKAGQFSKKDLDFIIAVKNFKQLPIDHPLDRVALVANRISDIQYETEGVRNLDLVRHLLANKPYPDVRLSAIFSKFAPANIDFLQFLEALKEKSLQDAGAFLGGMIGRDKTVCGFLLTRAHLTDAALLHYLELIINFSEKNDVLSQNDLSKLKNFMAERPILLAHDSSANTSALIALIKALKVRFVKPPDKLVIKHEVLETLWNNGLYSIDPSMLSYMLAYRNETYNKIEDDRQQYTYLHNPGNEAVLEFIEANINIYVEDVFLVLPDHDQEHEGYIVKLLSNEGLNPALRTSIIEKVSFKLSDFTNVPVTMWNDILLNQRIKVSWSNIVEYATVAGENDQPVYGLSDPLYNFLNLPDTVLDAGKLPDRLTDANDADTLGLLVIDIIESGKLRDEVAAILIQLYKDQIEDFDFSNTSEAVAKLLIDQGTVRFNIVAVVSLKKRFPSIADVWIKSNWDTFIARFTDFQVDSIDIIRWLAGNLFSNEQQLQLYEKIDKEILYNILMAGIRVPKIVMENNDLMLKGEELTNLIANDRAERQTTVNAISSNINHLQEAELHSLLRKLGGDYERIANGKAKWVKKSTEMLNMLEALKELQYIISDFTENENGIDVTILAEPEAGGK